MKLKCPTCSSMVTELVSCDICQTVGCIRCVVRMGKQLVCYGCKSGKKEEPKEADLFSMFG